MGGFINKVGDKLFGSKLGKIDPVLGLQAGYASGFKGMFDDISGKTQQDAAEDAAKLQYQAMMAGVDEQRAARLEQQQNLAPFRQLGSPQSLGLWSQMGMQPQDYSYNPASDTLLQNAANVAGNKVLNLRAAQGKAGSGGTELAINEALAPIYMQRQGQMFDQQFNARNQRFAELGNIVGAGQNAAAGLGAVSQTAANNIANMRGQGANALAAGSIAGANAQAQGTQNIVGMIAALAPFFAASDERLKENIMFLGKDEEGNNVYEFEYKDSKPKYVGYMAQEVMKKDPSNVILDAAGYMHVGPRYAPKRVG